MAKTPANDSFQARIHQIIAGASAQIAAAARAEIAAARAHVAAPAKPAKAPKAKGKPGRPAAPTTPTKATGKGRGRKKAGGLGADVTDKVFAAIKANGGQRAEQIQKAVGLPAPQVKAALAKLREEKRVTTTGQARGTAYTAT